MSNWLLNTKTEADSLPQVKISILKKEGLLNNPDIRDYSNIEVDSGIREICGKFSRPKKFIFGYWVSEGDTRRKIQVWVDIFSTRCNFGGKRWWFICPQNLCNRNVGILYVKDKILACRHCHNLSYASQNENKRCARLFYLEKLDDEYGELHEKMKRRYYAGKPTRIQRKINELDKLIFRLYGFK
jgi:hypothetical protein